MYTISIVQKHIDLFIRIFNRYSPFNKRTISYVRSNVRKSYWLTLLALEKYELLPLLNL